MTGASIVSDLLLVCEGETELFDNRVGQHFTRNALDLGLRRLAGEPAVKSQLKIFALAHFFEPLVAHLLKRSLDRLALGIENTLLQRDVNVSFHRLSIIRQRTCASEAGGWVQARCLAASIRCCSSANASSSMR